MPPKHVPKMNCCVPLCRNTDDNCPITVNDSREWITFNRFPTTPEQRAVWLEVLGLTESDLPPGAVVCSEHFKRNDFTVMNDGTVKLMENSIPLQFCMICLASGNSKMYPMNQNYLQKAYTTMTGIAVSYIRDKTSILPRLCAECAQRLVNCERLRDKSLRAYKSLMQILHNDKVLTLHNLKSVNRVRKQLTSNLLKHTFGADYYDLYVKYNEDSIKIHVKEENHSDIEENTEIRREKCDNSEKVAKEFHVESLNESDDFQNDVLFSDGINNDDNLNCDNIYNDDNLNCDNINYDDSTNRDISNFCLNDNVVQVISKDFDDNDIINPDVTNVTDNVFNSNSDDKLKSGEDHIKHGIDDDVDNGCGDTINEHNNLFLKKKYMKVNRLVGNKSGNKRVILKNAMFVKESRPNILNNDLIPITDKTNENAQFPKVLDIINPDVTNVTNNGFMISNSNEEVKSVEEIIKHGIDDDIENGCDDTINELNNVSLKNKIVKLNRLKNGNKSGNRVILNKEIINPDVTNVTNNVFMISNSDEKVKSVEEIIKHVIDDDVENGCDDTINELNNVSLKNKILKLNRLKNGNKSGNKRVILQNAIFVKESRPNILNNDLIPRTDKVNEKVQFPKVFYSKVYCKNINNAQTIEKDVEGSTEHVILNNRLLGVFKENKSNKNDRHLGSISKIVKTRILKTKKRILFDKLVEKSNKNDRQLSSTNKVVKTRVPKTKKRNLFDKLIEKSNKNDRELSSTNKVVETHVSKRQKPNLNDKLFTKTILTYEEQLADIQKRQEAENYSTYPYKCDICFTGRCSLFTYNRHMDKHTDKYGKLECDICGFRYKSRPSLTRHLREHTERYSCKRCDFVSGSRSLVTLHARWHAGVASKCPHCELKFRKLSSYFTHLRLKHASRFACPLCGYCFVSEHGVKTHISFSHPFESLQNLSGPSCERCDIRFASEAAYDKHMSVSVKHITPGFVLRNQATEMYKRSRKGLKSRSPQNKGTNITQFKFILCEVCGKKLNNVTLLKEHMNVHAGVRPYQCELCSKSYTSKFSLRGHQLLSHGERARYPCAVCHMDFSTNANRHRHMQTHDPSKRLSFTCHICSKSFTTKVGKDEHVVHVHQQVPRPKRNRAPARARARARKHGDASDASARDTEDANMAS